MRHGADGGEIRFDGRRITGRATEEIVRLGVAHVPEGRGTFVRVTVEENLQLGAMTRRDRAAIARISSKSTIISRASRSGGGSRREPCLGASSRCSRSAVR